MQGWSYLNVEDIGAISSLRVVMNFRVQDTYQKKV